MVVFLFTKSFELSFWLVISERNIENYSLFFPWLWHPSFCHRARAHNSYHSKWQHGKCTLLEKLYCCICVFPLSHLLLHPFGLSSSSCMFHLSQTQIFCPSFTCNYSDCYTMYNSRNSTPCGAAEYCKVGSVMPDDTDKNLDENISSNVSFCNVPAEKADGCVYS